MEKLLSRGSSDRACVSASAAVNANIGVDNVRCALGNSLYGAACCASAAADAIFTDFVCHNSTSIKNL